ADRDPASLAVSGSGVATGSGGVPRSCETAGGRGWVAVCSRDAEGVARRWLWLRLCVRRPDDARLRGFWDLLAPRRLCWVDRRRVGERRRVEVLRVGSSSWL